MSDIATAFADEVVTNAYTKIISVPGIEGPFALITLDNGFDHTKPSSFGPGGLAAFDAALDEAFAANRLPSPSPASRSSSPPARTSRVFPRSPLVSRDSSWAAWATRCSDAA